MWNVSAIVLPNGAIYWVSSAGQERDNEGITVTFGLGSTSKITDLLTEHQRERRLERLKKVLEKNEIFWLVPSDQKWNLNLDSLKDFLLQRQPYFTEITTLDWFAGSIGIEPQLEINELQSLGVTHYDTRVSFRIVPEIVKTRVPKQGNDLEQPPQTDEEIAYRKILLRTLRERLSEDELKDIYFDVDIDYRSLTAGGKNDQARALVDHFSKRRKLGELGRTLTEHRPDITLPDSPI